MTILLAILKWIGIILLILLVILLTLVSTVLFVPIRYRLDGAYKGTLMLEAKITWFFHLISASVSYTDELIFSVRAAGYRIFPGKKKTPKEVSPENRADSAYSVPEEMTVNADGRESETAAPEADGDFGYNTAADHTESQNDKNTGNKSPEPQKEKFFEKIQKKISALVAKIRNIFNNIEKIRRVILHYTDIVLREDSKRAIGFTFSQLVKILKHVMPQKMDVYFEIGTGDPASTGQILAIQGMLYPLICDKICIVPDFEEKRAEGSFHIKGRIRIIAVMICGIRIILMKEVRTLIRQLTKKEETRG